MTTRLSSDRRQSPARGLGRHLYCCVEVDFPGAATRSNSAMAWSRNRKSVFPKPTQVKLDRSLNPT